MDIGSWRTKRTILFVRATLVVLVPLVVWADFESQFEWYRYTLDYFIEFFLASLFLALFFNGGLFFVTTEAAKKYRVTSTVCYLPSIFLTPLTIGAGLGIPFSVTVLFVYSLVVFFCFNPWK